MRRGLRYANGQTEQIQLGRLRVESVSWDSLETTASLELADRMAQVRDEPFGSPYSAKGKTAAGAAIEIVQQVFGATISYAAPFNPPGLIGDVIYVGPRTDALSALEESYGAETYFDANGDFIFAQKPTGDEPVVWDVDASQTGVLINAGESLDRTGIYNGVYVQGQPAADVAPIAALAIYTDPASPIRWGGPFGKVLLVADAAEVADVGQAQATANALLKLRLKQTRSLDLRAAPNPALEAGDTVKVTFPDGRVENHLVDAVETNLSTEAQQIVTRSQIDPGTISAADPAEALAA